MREGLAVTIDEAFLAGLDLVRRAGLAVRGTDIRVLAAERVFTAHAAPVRRDPRFSIEGPQYAKQLILEALALDAT